MSTVLDYYEYAKLAAAAYVILDGQPLDGANVAGQANSQERLPKEVANQTLDPAANPNSWTIPLGGYFGNDAEGFAATLFQRTTNGATEKVLAIRGTEPGINFYQDLLKADIGGKSKGSESFDFLSA